MTKAELIKMIENYPDNMQIVFTQKDEKETDDIYDMYLEKITECSEYNYIDFHLRWIDTGD